MSQQYIAYSSRGGGGGGGVTSLNSLVGGLTLAAGSGITITDDGAHTITITAVAATSGNLTDVGTDGIVITGGTGAVLGAGTSLAQHVADTTHNGYLSSTDWNTFNGKQAAGNYITALTSDVTASGPGSAVATIANSAVTNAKMANMVTGTAKANISGSTAAPSDVALVSAATASSIVLRDGSGNFAAGTITASLTGHASLDLALTGGTMSGAIAMGTNKITGVGDPSAAQDAATKNYVDSVASGLQPKEAVSAASTADITGTYSNGVAGVGATFTITATGALSLDGVSPAVGARVLLKDQSSGLQNGIYDVTVAGTTGVSPVLTRSSDYNTASDIDAGDLIPVVSGTVNATTSWLQTATVTTVGTDALVFAQFTASPASYLKVANNLSDVNSASTSFNNISGLTTLGDLVYGGASGTRSRLAGNTTSAKQYLSQTGTGTVSAAPAWASISAADILAGTLSVARGGTGAATLTAHGVLIGNTTSAVNITSAGTSGQVLTSNGASADPTFQAVAVTLANTSKSANYTLTDADDVVEVSASGAWTLTLHDATTAKQKAYYIKRTDQALSNVISLATTSSQTVDGYASTAIKIATQYECFVLYPDGTNWKILDHKCITPWTSYNLTIGAATTPPTKGTVAVDLAQWRRVGDSLEFWYVYRQTAAGSAGSGQYKYPLPSGATIDTNKVDAAYGANQNVFASLGKAWVSLGSAGKSSVTMAEIVCFDTTNLGLVVNDTASSNIQTTMTNGTGATVGLNNTNVAWSIKCSVPISGWIE